MQAPSWKLEAEARHESLPGWYTIGEASRLCGYTNPAYLSKAAIAGKFLSYKIGLSRLVPEGVAEYLAEKSLKK